MTTTEILTGIKTWVLSKLSLKQDVINDLAAIRSGSQAGSTAVQPSDLSSYFNNASYDTNTHRINFYHGQNIVAYVDASPFIVDGMVNDVRIENGHLVIDFNTDSGKQDISIPLTEIFDPSNYYNKTQTNELLAQKQDVIQDLADIRSGAQAGSTAVQPSTLGSVIKNTVAESGVYDVSANNDNTKFESLSTLLSSANLNTLIPTDIRKGGMSIKFIQSSDNKYVLKRCMATSFSTNVYDWQSIDDDEFVTNDNDPITKNNLYLDNAYEVGYSSASYELKTNGKFGASSSNKHIYLGVNAGERYHIGGVADYVLRVAFATSAASTGSGTIPVVPGTSVVEVPANTGIWVKIPEGCTFLLLWRKGLATGFNIRKAIYAIDDVPVYNSNNYVKSGGVYNKVNVIPNKEIELTIVPGNYNADGSSDDNTAMHRTSYAITQQGLYSFSCAMRNQSYCLLCDANDNIIQSWNGSTDGTGLKQFAFYALSGYTIKLSSLATQDIKLFIIQGLNSFMPIEYNSTFLNTHGLSVVKIESSGVENNLIRLDGSTTVSGDWRNYHFPARKNHVYVLRSSCLGSVVEGFAAISTAKDSHFVECVYESVRSQTIYTAVVYTDKDIDTIKIICDRNIANVYCYEYSYPYFFGNSEEPKDSISEQVILPSTIFTLPYKNNSIRGIFNRLYIEGIAKSRITSLRINGEENVVADVNSNTESGNYTKSVTITADGYESYTDTIAIKSAAISAAFNKPIRLMCIGDSLTAGTYPTLAETIFKQLGAENSNKIKALFVGTRILNSNGVVGSYTYTNRACNEGRAGWAVSDYMRHICRTAARYMPNSSDTIVEKAAWDSLGLATKTRNGVSERETRIDWTSYSASKGEAIRTTCHGYYDADPSQELWNWLVNKRGLTTFTYNGTTYTFGATYSNADDAAQIAAIKYLCENWNLNPFFDYATVNSSNGQYAFNFGVYVNKYKTLASDGETRLVVGSTAGSLVEDATAYDVVTPTHVSIIMAQNDYNNGTNGTGVADDMVAMAGLIRAYDNTIKIAIASNRLYGVFDTAYYGDYGAVRQMGSVNAYQLSVYTRLMELKDTYTDYTFLPLYAIQSPLGYCGYTSIDALDQREKPHAVRDDNIHTTLKGYLDRAYLVSAWVVSTLES